MTEPRRSGRPRTPAFSRESVAEAVVDLVCEKGFAGWSMRDLAGRLGLSTGTLTHHFAGRDAVAVAAMDYVYVLPPDWSELKSALVWDRLRRLTEIFIVPSSSRRQRWWQFWVEYMAAAGRDAELREAHEARYRRQRDFFARLIAEAAEGSPHVDAEAEAERLLAVGNGLAIQQLATPTVITAATASALLIRHLKDLEATIGARVAEPRDSTGLIDSLLRVD